MPTFQRIPEVVDARQFEGGSKSGNDLVLWVNSNGGHAAWIEEHVRWRRGDRTGTAPESIRLYEGPYEASFNSAFTGDWIMQHQDGSFEVVRQQTLDADYIQL